VELWKRWHHGHENWAHVLNDAGRESVLFGYTDASVDPRDYDADHPALTTYEGVLPGLTTVKTRESTISLLRPQCTTS
jgi:hypothetical protein